jgi:anti-anti-sigma factor
MLRRVTWETAFTTTSTHTASTSILSVSGELDVAVAFRLSAEIDRALAHDPRTFVLDLSDVSFIDATGMRPLYRAACRCRDSGRRMVLLRGAPCIESLFATCGLSHHFEILDGLEDLHRIPKLAAAI